VVPPTSEEGAPEPSTPHSAERDAPPANDDHKPAIVTARRQPWRGSERGRGDQQRYQIAAKDISPAVAAAAAMANPAMVQIRHRALRTPNISSPSETLLASRLGGVASLGTSALGQ
jgi:hypothetical protein